MKTTTHVKTETRRIRNFKCTKCSSGGALTMVSTRADNVPIDLHWLCDKCLKKHVN